ncbi:hypothetical protein R1flu_005887 [Riccia fluitans]|uniref:Trichohyalin-plectin-homology domain-containing protein n=1 Tax=Riccia fluitans TaxID=41844 RepID=A0ABD1YUP1_9MARC
MAPVDEGQIIHSCHCTEISADEYRRVAGLKPVDDRVEKFLQQKEELKVLCEERIKKWPNTLKNLRENRVKNIRRRIEKEELEESNLQLLKPHIKELHYKALMDQVMKLAQRRTVIQRQLAEKKAAGERFKKQAVDDVIAAEEAAKLKEERRIRMNKEFLDFNIKLQEARDREKEKQKQLDIQIAEYVANKQRRDDTMKAQQDHIQSEKNRIRDRQIQQLAKQLQEARIESETRLAVAEHEARIAEDMREQIFAARRRKDWETCDRSRQIQIRLKKELDEAEAEDAKFKAAQVWQRVLEVQEMDEAEFEATRKRNKEIADSQRKLAEDRKVAAKVEKHYEIEEFKTNWKKMAEDDEYIKNIRI